MPIEEPSLYTKHLKFNCQYKVKCINIRKHSIKIPLFSFENNSWIQTDLPLSLSISRQYCCMSGFLPSPHFTLRLLGPAAIHSSRGGTGGKERVLTFTTGLNPPTPILFTACTRTLQKKTTQINGMFLKVSLWWQGTCTIDVKRMGYTCQIVYNPAILKYDWITLFDNHAS